MAKIYISDDFSSNGNKPQYVTERQADAISELHARNDRLTQQVQELQLALAKLQDILRITNQLRRTYAEALHDVAVSETLVDAQLIAGCALKDE